VLVRFGGEEFVILLPHTDIKQANILLEKIRNIVEKNRTTDNITFTISIGLSQYTQAEDIETLLKRADEKLYIAKSSGKNKIGI
ncbi:MAG: GGDEF domain-containing protein, partial [Campylobacterota bacterium]|nr:GGDEF domain-containing protein [Campylobacterota bacterium]